MGQEEVETVLRELGGQGTTGAVCRHAWERFRAPFGRTSQSLAKLRNWGRVTAEPYTETNGRRVRTTLWKLAAEEGQQGGG